MERQRDKVTKRQRDRETERQREIENRETKIDGEIEEQRGKGRWENRETKNV